MNQAPTFNSKVSQNLNLDSDTHCSGTAEFNASHLLAILVLQCEGASHVNEVLDGAAERVRRVAHKLELTCWNGWAHGDGHTCQLQIHSRNNWRLDADVNLQVDIIEILIQIHSCGGDVINGVGLDVADVVCGLITTCSSSLNFILVLGKDLWDDDIEIDASHWLRLLIHNADGTSDTHFTRNSTRECEGTNGQLGRTRWQTRQEVILLVDWDLFIHNPKSFDLQITGDNTMLMSFIQNTIKSNGEWLALPGTTSGICISGDGIDCQVISGCTAAGHGVISGRKRNSSGQQETSHGA